MIIYVHGDLNWRPMHSASPCQDKNKLKYSSRVNCGRTEGREITKIGMKSHLIVRYNHTEEKWFPIKSSRYIGDSLRIGKRSVSPVPLRVRSPNSGRILVSGLCGHTVRTNLSSSRIVDLKNVLAQCIGLQLRSPWADQITYLVVCTHAYIIFRQSQKLVNPRNGMELHGC